MSDGKSLVVGASGFVGSRLTQFLRDQGHAVIAVCRNPDVECVPGVEYLFGDCRDPYACQRLLSGDVKWIYNLAASVGGIDYISKHKVASFNSVLINTNLLSAASRCPDLAGYLFTSSACVYGSTATPIKESEMLRPSSGYGDEKVFSEKACAAYSQEYNIPMRIIRPTGIYGPGDAAKGRSNRDHVPAALTRKIIAAKLSKRHEITIWGDGGQTRDFLYIDDAVQAMYRLQNSGVPGCVTTNVGGFGNSESITINGLVDILEEIAAIKLTRFYSPAAPTGVRYRCLDNSYLFSLLRWQPSTPLTTGMENLYREIWESETVTAS